MKTTVTLQGGRTTEAELVPYTGGTLAVYPDENPAWARNCGQPRSYWYIVHVSTGLGIARFTDKQDAVIVARQLYGRLPAQAWKQSTADELSDLIDREVGGEWT